MNIRKILKEEINDFDWVHSIEEPDLVKTLELALKDTTFPVFVKKLFRMGMEMVVIQDEMGNSFETFSMDRINKGEHTFDTIIKMFERNCEMPWDGDEQTKREYCEIYASLLEYKKKNLTNLKEDFDWVEGVPSVVLGDGFDEHSIDNEFWFEDGKIVYYLDWGRFRDLVIGDENHYAEKVILSNGNYTENYAHEYYINEDEINYLVYSLDGPRRNRLMSAVSRAIKLKGDTISKDELESMFEENFLKVEKYIGSSFYSGVWDFDDFTSEYLGHISNAINRNRWEDTNQHYKRIISKYNLDIEGDDMENSVTIRLDYPFKHPIKKNKEIYNVTDILETGLVFYLGFDWSEAFMDAYDVSGSEWNIREDFDRFIETIEGVLDEKEGNQ